MAYEIQSAVRPHLGKQTSKMAAGRTSSGDTEFAIDEVAERAIEKFIRKHELHIAYYSEGRGLIKFGEPEHLLIIDPIDGTRPAMVGLEGGVISIAVAPYSTDACLSDVHFGCILELKADRLFTAAKDGSVRFTDEGVDMPVRPTANTDLDRISWTFEHAGRPAELVSRVLSPLIDRSSIRGGVFVISGTAFSLTRLVSGQLDAVVDVGNRILTDHPEFRQQFVRAGLGGVIGLFPYDIAAAVLIARMAGCCVTDAYGRSLDDTPLLDTSESNISSLVAASNPMLHAALLDAINAGMEKLST